jgi:putative oxidoreductase
MQAIASDRLRGWGPTILRVVVGLIFLAHGTQKLLGQGFGGVGDMMEGIGVPAPAVAAVALVLVELVGGAALVLGLFTRLLAVPLAFSMLVATVTVHLPNGFFSSGGGVEFTLLLIFSGGGERAIAEVRGVDRGAALGGEDEVPILVGRAGLQSLFGLPRPVALEGVPSPRRQAYGTTALFRFGVT